MPVTETPTHYDILGVDQSCTVDELRKAYRTLARQYHPDVVDVDTSNSDSLAMVKVNEAWKVLSNEKTRRIYDQIVKTPERTTQPPPQTKRARREAWAAGIQAQIVRLADLAGRSATQTMLTRQPRGTRSDYQAIVTQLVDALAQDVEPRVRAARAAGAAPLDLGVAATLIGIRTEADRMRRQSELGVADTTLMAAELLDRMWDVLAHELPRSLPEALGGNPHVSRILQP